MENISARLLRGSVWISASRGAVNLLGIVSTIVLARLLMPADFGLVAIGTTMLAILTAITNMSLAQALVHHEEPTPEHFGTAWTLNGLRGLAIGALFAAAGPPAAILYGDPRVATVMAWLGFSVFLSGLTNPRRVMLQKQLIFWQDFTLNVSQKLLALIVSVVVALVFRNYWALIAGIVAGQLANVVVSYTVLPYRPKITFRYARDLWSFSLWLTLSQAINTVNWRFDQLLIAKFLGKTDLGYYTVGDNLSSLPSREATAPLTQTLFPAFALLRHDRARLRAAYQRAQAIVTAIALPVGVGIALVARPLIALLMGDKWLPSAYVIEVLASIFALQTLGTAAQPLAMSQGATQLLFKRDTQLFFIRVPIIAVGMFAGGLPGVLAARVLTGLIAILFNLYLIKRLIGLSLRSQLAANGRALMATGAMIAVVFPIVRTMSAMPAPIVLALAGAAGAVAYVSTSWVAWRVAGRPDGPEQEVRRLGGRFGLFAKT